MQTECLTWQEKAKISNQKDVFVILRSIMFLKMCKGIDKIDDQTYKQEVGKLKKKYQLFTSMIPNFDLLKYCQEFSIPQQEIQGALSQIQGNFQQKVFLILMKGQKISSQQLWMTTTASFIEIGDFCSLNVGETKFAIQNLLDKLNSISLDFGSSELNEKIKKLQNMRIDEELTELEMKEIKLQVKGLYHFLFDLTGRANSQKKSY